MNHHSQIIEWGSAYLFSKGYNLEHPPAIFVETPWSSVIRFSTSSGDFYLKQTPADLFVETKVIKAIQKNMPDSPTPTILNENLALHCFLMNSCGDYSLRTKFNGLIQSNLLIQGLHSYINILRSFEKNIESLQAIGVPDWRLEHLPTLYLELLENKALLSEEGLSLDELDKLMELVPTIKSICVYLSSQGIKETLVNGDFNENNLILDEKTQHITIIDWGESVITHPFFTIAAHLRSIARRYQLALDGQFLEKIKQQCLACWSDLANRNELNIIYQQMLKLEPLFASLAIYRLQAATKNKSKEKQNWFISRFLRMLIQNG